MRIIKQLCLLPLFALLTACGSSTPGMDELKTLCEKDGGLKVYKTIEVDGFYDATTKCHHCWDALISGPFQYLDFCDLESERSPLSYVLEENGCYRLSKVSRDSGQCHAGVDKKIAKIVTEPTASFREKQCVKVERIDEPGSLYRYVVDSEEFWLDKSIRTLIRKTTLRLEDVEEGDLVARDISYILTPKNAGTGLPTSPMGCDAWALNKERKPEYKGTRDAVFLETVINSSKRSAK